MGSTFLGLFILSSLFSKGFSVKYFEVHYEVNDFADLAETRFQISHDIVKRSAAGNISSTANPFTKAWTKTTPKYVTTPRSSSDATIASLPTVTPSASGRPSVKPTTNLTIGGKTIPWTTTTGKSSTTHSSVRLTTTKTTTTTTGSNVTNNITIFEDNHDYFESRYYSSGERWWFDLNDGSGTPKLHVGLTKNLKYSDTIKTTFKFPYYGHEIDKVTITNKGFLFLGETLHKFNASMQYVAPLMADFGAHLHNKTSIHYVDTGDRFTVEWKNLKLQNQQVGEFSFQCSVLKNGTIVFAYKKIPVAVSEIKNNTFPVRVGMSDSLVIRYVRHGLFIIDGKVYFRIRYFVYYRYHQVKLRRQQVKDGSAFVMTPLPNCILFKSCDTCVKSKTQFSCKWCRALRRCSDGIDRYRHSWLVAQCDKNSETTCSRRRPSSPRRPRTTKAASTTSATGKNEKTKSRGGSSSNKRAGRAVLIVFCVLVVVAIACWFAYAYTHPLSKSGMFLMRYGNPRKWCGNSGRSGGGGKITFKSMSHDSTA